MSRYEFGLRKLLWLRLIAFEFGFDTRNRFLSCSLRIYDIVINKARQSSKGLLKGLKHKIMFPWYSLESSFFFVI